MAALAPFGWLSRRILRRMCGADGQLSECRHVPFLLPGLAARGKERRLLVAGPDHLAEARERPRLEVRVVRVAGKGGCEACKLLGLCIPLLREGARCRRPPEHLGHDVACRRVL